MKPALQQINANDPYCKFIRQESEVFYQASLLMNENRHPLAWKLFAFWKALNPFEVWKLSESPNRLIESVKQEFFLGFESVDSSVPSIASWSELKPLFSDSTELFLIDILNGFEASNGTIRFPTFRELEFYLKKVGGSMALISAMLLFNDEIENGNIDFLEPIRYFGAGVLWWKLLQNTATLVQEGKLFIPLEDLNIFDCREEDLLAKVKSSNIEELTKFELQKVSESLKFTKKNALTYPKGLKEALTFLSNHYAEEIHSALRSKWVLSANPPLAKKQNKPLWFISNLTNFNKASLPK
jgi:phytoene synthase